MAYSGAYRFAGEERDLMTGSGGRDNRPERMRNNDGLTQRLMPLLKKLESIDLETEDLLLLLILYLLYRESGDKELLMTMGAMLLA